MIDHLFNFQYGKTNLEIYSQKLIKYDFSLGGQVSDHIRLLNKR